MTEQETKAVKAEALKAEEAPKAQAPSSTGKSATQVLKDLKNKESGKPDEGSGDKDGSSINALIEKIKAGLPKEAGGSTVQTISEKFHTINEMRHERELQNVEAAKRTLEGAINSGDPALVRSALASLFDVAPESMELTSAFPSVSALREREVMGIDHVIGMALLILSQGSKTERARILDTLETQFHGRLWGYESWLEDNPQWDSISNRESDEKSLLGQHILYDSTMSSAEKRLFEYLGRKQRRLV